MELVDFFASDWGLLRFVAGFVILPLLYLRESAEMHKEFGALFEKIGTGDTNGQPVSGGDIENLAAKLHVFDLDWWLLGAGTALLVGIFLLGDMARFSDLLTEEQRNGSAVRGGLNIFGLGVALAAVGCVEWAKFDAYRALQQFWRGQASSHVSGMAVAPGRSES